MSAVDKEETFFSLCKEVVELQAYGALLTGSVLFSEGIAHDVDMMISLGMYNEHKAHFEDNYRYSRSYYRKDPGIKYTIRHKSLPLDVQVVYNIEERRFCREIVYKLVEGGIVTPYKIPQNAWEFGSWLYGERYHK